MDKWMRAAVMTLGLVLAGCELVDQDTPPDPLAVVRGTVSAAPGTDLQGELSLVVLWLPRTALEYPSWTLDSSGTFFFEQRAFVQQPVTYTASFPFDFEIPIRALPPAEARYDLSRYGGQGVASTGVLVAYLDLDHDGALDLGEPGKAGDTVVGFSLRGAARGTPGFVVSYLDGQRGAQDPLAGESIPQGFSLLVLDETPGLEVRTPMDRVALDLSSFSPADQVDALFYGCRTLTRRLSFDAAAPEPAGAQRSCPTAPRCYAWLSPTPAGACSFVEKSGEVCLADGQPKPADWPCP